MTINYIKCFCSDFYLLTVDVTFHYSRIVMYFAFAAASVHARLALFNFWFFCLSTSSSSRHSIRFCCTFVCAVPVDSWNIDEPFVIVLIWQLDANETRFPLSTAQYHSLVKKIKKNEKTEKQNDTTKLC